MLIPHFSKLRLLAITFSFFAMALCWTSTPARSQNITGTILGTISDPSGASVPDARVTITNLATNQSHGATTSKTGTYEVPYLPPGQYQVTVSHTGFKTTVRKGITLEVDRRLVINLRLQLGSTATSVTVTGQTPLLNTTSAALGQVVSSRTTEALPILGRNIFDLAALSAGVMVNPKALGGVASAGTVTGTTQTPLFVSSDISINGGRYRTNDYLVDGVTVMMPANNNFAIAPTPANTAEFKVLTNSFGPQYGRSGGGVISVVTKSGTNHWHGEAYDFLRNRRLNANNYFADAQGQSKGPSTFDLFGGYAGGPLIKNDTFIFGGFEGSRNHGLQSGLNYTVPTALERNGDFSQTFDSRGNPVTIYNPFSLCGAFGNPACATDANGQPIYTRQPFQNNVIPTSRMNPVALKLMSYVPLPNQPGTGPQQANNYGWAQNEFANSNQWSVRIDHRFTDRNSLFGRVTRNTGELGNTGQFGTIADNVLGVDVSHVINVVLNDTYTVSPTNFLNLRYGLTRLFEGRTPIHGAIPLT
ncbi:MAG TPA: carboxypeptidase regulatory-like domain-containing protein, partial [Candidatus Acidoferrales bacterium]|nr:carboxypeptidase regulatory-like domain-containing protein [Candidatus Acidoferrales bacterium]